MADVTVTQFAEALKIPVDRLMTQLDEAGIQVGAVTDIISDDKKMVLLSHLRRNHGHDVTTESASPKQITLKRKQSSELRLAAGQGRTRTVNVEVRRKRTYVNREVLEAQAREERDRRAASVEDVRAEHHQAEEEARRQVEEETRKREAEESRRREEEDARKLAAEEEAKRREAEETRLKEENQRKAAEDARRADEAKRAREREARQARDRRGAAAARPGATKYGRAELHVAQDKSGRRRKKRPARRRQISVSSDGQHGFERPTAPVVREVTIPETISVSELSQRMAVKANEVIRQFMGLGAMVTINQVIDQETAALVVEEMGHTPKLLKENELEEQVLEAGQAQGETVPRPPVVTIMGHVDHGKTSLLDFIRSTRVTAGEAGGITQHIGAYHIASDKGGITFLDTPGHAAFTAMRARGAEVTDIVILVVAADDGVMPQTIEAIQHAKAAEVPVIVAINKIDRPEADPERVKNELTQHSIIPEDWGGDNMFVEVSAKTGQGVDSLLERILLQAELLELRAVDTGPASGVVLESSLEKGRGAVATLLIASGRLKVGDSILAGQEHGRVRAMFDDSGEPATEEGPSMPVQVLGLSGTPNAGDDVVVLADERKAREVALHRQGKLREVKLARQQGAKLEDFMKDMADQQKTMLNIVIKADVQGSAEALKDALSSLSRDEVQVNVVMSGVGGINESDVNLALSSEAIVIGFNVRADASSRTAVAEKGIDLHYHSVIYEAIDQIKRAVGGMLAPEIKEQIRGLAEVREVFKSPKFGNVAGCMVLDGFVRRNLPIRVLRDNVVIYEGELESLRRFKDDVNEVRAGTECGIGVLNYKDVRDGDQIECFERYEVAREI